MVFSSGSSCRHNDSINAVFVDCHVETLKKGTIRNRRILNY